MMLKAGNHQSSFLHLWCGIKITAKVSAVEMRDGEVCPPIYQSIFVMDMPLHDGSYTSEEVLWAVICSIL